MNIETKRAALSVELSVVVFAAELLNIKCTHFSYIAANQMRALRGESLAYGEDDFLILAEKSRDIAEKAHKVQKALYQT